MKSGIYKIVNPSGKVYIGQSVNVNTRLKQYKNLKNCQQQRLLYNSFLKYGVSNHIFSIVEFCEISLLNEREFYRIEIYNCLNRKFGLNIRNACSLGKHSEETKNIMSNKHKGKIVSDLTKQKMSLAKKQTPTKYWMGKKRSQEDILKFKISHIGLINAAKKIECYDLQMNKIDEYVSASDAARKLSISRSAIKNNLLGYSKTCNNKIFKYAL